VRYFLPYQSELIRTVAKKDVEVVVVQKSRRTGYSLGAGALAVKYVARPKAEGGMNVFYMGYNLEMAREFINYVGDWAKEFNAVSTQVGETFFKDPDHPDRDIKAFRAEFSSGHSVIALPSVPRALRGQQGLVIIDEAAFHDDLTELLKSAFALLMWGGKVVVLSTHDGDTNPFNKLVTDIQAKRKNYTLLTCDLDRALVEGLYKLICKEKGEEWSMEKQVLWRENLIKTYGEGADEELFCLPSKGTGAYLPPPLIEARQEDGIPVVRLALPDSFTYRPEFEREREIENWCKTELLHLLEGLPTDLLHYFGEDFARNGDLTTLWPMYRMKNMTRRCAFLVELRNVPFEQQRQIVFFIIDRLPRFCAGAFDATGNGAYLAEVCAQRYGQTRIAEVKLSDAWYKENMPPFKAAFEDATTILPRDADVYDDHRAIKLMRGTPKIPRDERSTSKGGKRHGDTAIAHALAYTASRMDVAPIEFMAEDPKKVVGRLFGESDTTDLSLTSEPMDWSIYDA